MEIVFVSTFQNECVHLFGSGGASMIAIMLFMAIVSTGSAESIAVSSLVSYDIYREYICPTFRENSVQKAAFSAFN